MHSLAVEHEEREKREKREAEIHALASADKPLPVGTRIAVVGYGIGSYATCVERWVGANDHTIEFDDGRTATIQLRELQWTVAEADMDSLVGLEPELAPETQLEPEPEPEPEVLPEGSPPSKGKDQGSKKKKKPKKKKRSKPTAEASSVPPSAPPPPPPPPPLQFGGSSSPPALGSPSSSPKVAGGRGDLLAAIHNGGIGMLKKTAVTESSVVQAVDPAPPHESQEVSAGRPKPRESQYGPPWDKKPPAGLDIIGEM
jgi:hypothetical protein